MSKLVFLSDIGLSNELLVCIKEKTFNMETIFHNDFTDILRAARYSKYVRTRLLELMNFSPLPLKLEYKLQAHQNKCITFIKQRESMNFHGMKGGIVAQEMGLGKTCTLGSYILMTKHDSKFPTLVVCDKTLIDNVWGNEMKKFFGKHVRVLLFHKDFLGKDLATITRDAVLSFDIVITTYDLVQTTCRKYEYDENACERGEQGIHMDKIIEVKNIDKKYCDDSKAVGPSILFKTPWSRIIADESTKFANSKTSIYRAMMSLYGEYKWCLSGTPIQNYETDIWAQMRWLGYNGIETATQWKRKGEFEYKNKKLHECILRMTTEDANIVLPPKVLNKKTIILESEEKEIYNMFLEKTRKAYDSMLNSMTSYAGVLAMFIRLRQVCIAPFLLTALSKRKKAKKRTEQDGEAPLNDKELEMFKKDGKMTELGKWLHDRDGTSGIYSARMNETIKIAEGSPKEKKFIFFSSFTACLDLFAYALDKRTEFEYVMIDGSTTGSDRKYYLDKFKTDINIKFLLMTYKVGSKGLTITEATGVISNEPWWCPAVTEQAYKRAHRPGQKYQVDIYETVMVDTIEEQIYDMCDKKREMADSYLDGSRVKFSAKPDKWTLGKILGIY